MAVVDFAGAQLLKRIQAKRPPPEAVSPSSLQCDPPLLIAHRGAHKEKGIRENTIMAMNVALELGADGVEFDLRKLKDGTVVVHHDEDLLRTHGRPLRLDALTLAALKYEAEDIPTLEEITASLNERAKTLNNRPLFFIELKTEGSAPWLGSELKALCDQLNQLRQVGHVFLMSFDRELLILAKTEGGFSSRELVSIAPLLPLKTVVDSIELGFVGATSHWSLMNSESLRLLKWAGLSSGVGFIDSEQVLARECSRGTRWLFTNQIRASFIWRARHFKTPTEQQKSGHSSSARSDAK